MFVVKVAQQKKFSKDMQIWLFMIWHNQQFCVMFWTKKIFFYDLKKSIKKSDFSSKMMTCHISIKYRGIVNVNNFWKKNFLRKNFVASQKGNPEMLDAAQFYGGNTPDSEILNKVQGQLFNTLELLQAYQEGLLKTLDFIINVYFCRWTT